ncbi:venom protease-like isoform X2 [Eurosta solidaginis]|uniref:venom protease-like isoform X2 n=1 Tax=Eurosta solidaginis TaxID=178769 RepID=UPI003530D2E2
MKTSLVLLLLIYFLAATSQRMKLRHGDSCQCQFNSCTCQSWSQCDLLHNWPTQNITFCNRRKGIVCCPDEPEEPEDFQPLSPAEVACSEFTKYAPEACPRPFIAGGELAKPGEFPASALIGIFDIKSNETEWICGGTLISERFVLSASHCTMRGAPNKVRLGDLDYSTTLDDAGLQEYTIRRLISHRQFTLQRYFDIMLIELNGSVSYTKYVLPACILTTNMMKYNTGLYWAVGWGRINESATFSPQLRRVQLKQQENCNEIATEEYDLARGVLERIQFCANGKIYDTCSGDSGGPLFAKFPHNQLLYRCMYMVGGIVSRGQEHCGVEDLPSINTNVTAFVRFIENFVWP